MTPSSPHFQPFSNNPSLAKRKILAALAQEYHDTTEAYDRTVCTGEMVQGMAMPANRQERGLTVAHATEVRKRLMAQAEGAGCTHREFQEAINNASKEM